MSVGLRGSGVQGGVTRGGQGRPGGVGGRWEVDRCGAVVPAPAGVTDTSINIGTFLETQTAPLLLRAKQYHYQLTPLVLHSAICPP